MHVDSRAGPARFILTATASDRFFSTRPYDSCNQEELLLKSPRISLNDFFLLYAQVHERERNR